MNLNKLVIGGAQLGMNYGFKKKQMKKKDKLNLLKFSLSKKINYIDLAQSYGDAENFIGNISIRKKFKVITKISNYKKINFYEIKKSIDLSLDKLKIKKIHYLMFHNFKDYKKIKKKDLQQLTNLKKNKFINFGISVYTPEEFLFCCKDKNVDFIQIPFNILDYRWINIDFLKLKKKYNVKIHVRSIFLKGSLLNNFNKIPVNKAKKKKIKDILNSFFKNKYNMLELCLNFIFSHSWIDKIIIGFNSIDQLKQIIKIKCQRIEINQKKFNFLPKKALMPKYWY